NIEIKISRRGGRRARTLAHSEKSQEKRMPKLTDERVLCAYVEGSDLHEVAPLLRSKLQTFIAGRPWATDQALFVDQIYDPDPELPDCLPDWDFGVNLGLDHIRQDEGWFDDIEALVKFLVGLHEESGRDFVLFLAYRSRPWLQEHLTFIDSNPVDLAWLKEIILTLS
ncbi:MAG: hypothetical protein L0220_04220, partial [Acidobacteria bacterium]|nr:hypothetical protein [Acidobacteriota bacterium]